MSTLWIPNQGVVPSHIRTAQLAVEAYDSRLELGFDERNQQWVVLWKEGPGGAPYPALGLGYELPGYEEIQRRLYAADTVRNSGAQLKEVMRRQEARHKEGRRELDEVTTEVAEALEHAFRRMGQTSYSKVYMPSKGI